MQTLEFSQSYFNGLPTIEDCSKSLDGISQKFKILRNVFRRHNVQNTFGLALLHRHFTLDSGERVVHHFLNGRSEAKVERNQKVFPCLWQLQEGTARPVEFAKGEIQSLNVLSPDFLEDLEIALRSLNLHNTLGLTSLIGTFKGDSVYVEHTDVPARCSTRVQGNGPQKGVPTLWAFDHTTDDTPQRTIVMCPACRDKP